MVRSVFDTRWGDQRRDMQITMSYQLDEASGEAIGSVYEELSVLGGSFQAENADSKFEVFHQREYCKWSVFWFANHADLWRGWGRGMGRERISSRLGTCGCARRVFRRQRIIAPYSGEYT